MSSAIALFAFENVTVRAGETTILDDVTLDIASRGITAVVGRSGSGKSTLLRLCNRLGVPTEGDVRFRGRNLDDLDVLELRRTVGMASQTPALFAGDVRGNLLVADPGATDAQMISGLEDLGLDAAMLSANVDELSGGEAQRVSVARTLIASPEVLLADEATSAVDPETRELIERRFRLLADDGVPVVWVTHDLARTDSFADEIIEISEGSVRSQRSTGREKGGDR